MGKVLIQQALIWTHHWVAGLSFLICKRGPSVLASLISRVVPESQLAGNHSENRNKL